MLVSSRRTDRLIIIVGAKGEARIVDVRGNMVWPEISAPRPIPIHRKELYEAINRETADKTTVKYVEQTNSDDI